MPRAPAPDVLFSSPPPRSTSTLIITSTSPIEKEIPEGIKSAVTAYFILFDYIFLLSATQATVAVFLQLEKQKNTSKGHLHSRINYAASELSLYIIHLAIGGNKLYYSPCINGPTCFETHSGTCKFIWQGNGNRYQKRQSFIS